MKEKTSKQRTYLVLGFLVILSSIVMILCSFDIFAHHKGLLPTLSLVIILMMLASGSSYVFFSFDILEANHNTDVSVRFMVLGLIIGILLPSLWILSAKFSGFDEMSKMFATLFIFLGLFLITTSFFVIMISIFQFKKHKKKT